MRILILGGTKFLGRHLAHAAVERGHCVTLWNRGQTGPELFPQLENLHGNRDGDLRALEGRKWDGVIDTGGYSSGKVRATATLLAASVAHYTFISSISVYQDFSKPGLNEFAPVGELPADAVEDENDANTYGARKALCEKAAEEAMPGRVLTVRSGLIVGPYDATDRFPYWVRRMALGGELIAPGHPATGVQLIDARDLAEWIIKMAESGKTGVFNATGPALVLTFQQMLEACKAASTSNARMIWVDDQFLLENGVIPFNDLPLWLPLASHKGFFAIDCRRAFAAGLACRQLWETATDVLAWWTAVGGRGKIGLTPERETQLLLDWRRELCK